MDSIWRQPLAFVDIETTGMSPTANRVIEIGVVRVEGGRIVRTFRSLVNPETAIPFFITNLTGITQDDIVAAPYFREIAQEVVEVLWGAIFVAHNVGFDYSFLKSEFGRLGITFAPPCLCTVKLSRALFPQYTSHKLGLLIERHGLSAPARHRAFDDAHCLWQFFQTCLKEFDLDTVEAALRSQRVYL